MRYRRNDNSPRTLITKFSGKCSCCGGVIKAGEMAVWYPSRKELWHLGGPDGNSARCAAQIRSTMYPDPGELAADRWNESHS